MQSIAASLNSKEEPISVFFCHYTYSNLTTRNKEKCPIGKKLVALTFKRFFMTLAEGNLFTEAGGAEAVGKVM